MEQKKISIYENIYRTTFDKAFEEPIPHVGIYIIAYMGKILYVGKAESSVTARLNQHIKHLQTKIGIWLYAMEFDWHNIRLDIIEPLDHQGHYWLVQTENACIKKFNPLFNDKLMLGSLRIDGVDKEELSQALTFTPTEQGNSVQ